MLSLFIVHREVFLDHAFNQKIERQPARPRLWSMRRGSIRSLVVQATPPVDKSGVGMQTNPASDFWLEPKGSCIFDPSPNLLLCTIATT